MLIELFDGVTFHGLLNSPTVRVVLRLHQIFLAHGADVRRQVRIGLAFVQVLTPSSGVLAARHTLTVLTTTSVVPAWCLGFEGAQISTRLHAALVHAFLTLAVIVLGNGRSV